MGQTSQQSEGQGNCESDDQLAAANLFAVKQGKEGEQDGTGNQGQPIGNSGCCE